MRSSADQRHLTSVNTGLIIFDKVIEKSSTLQRDHLELSGTRVRTEERK